MKHRKKTGIKQSELHEVMDYHPDGYLVWKVQRGSGAFPGKKVGTPDAKGRLQASVFGERMGVANIVWCWHTGVWPQNEGFFVDHKDNDPSNNRYPDNLRRNTHAENVMNGKAIKKSNDKNVATFAVDGKEIVIGRFHEDHVDYVQEGARSVLQYLRSLGRL